LGYSPEAPVPLRSGFGALKKQGEWVVPPYLKIQAWLGSVLLDFQQAKPISETIYIKVSGELGSIHMVVPHGWAAQVAGVSAPLGSCKSEVAEEPTPGFPLLYVSGLIALASVYVRYPGQKDIRRMNRLLAQERKIAR
jgi:hypothetical protein